MKHIWRSVGSAVLITALAACSGGTRSNEPYLPSRSSIQAGETITADKRETVYAIAREHNVSMRELIVLNDLHPPFEVRPGQRIVLPARSGADSDSGPGIAPAPDAAPAGIIESQPLPPIDAPVQSVPLGPVPSTNLRNGSQVQSSLAPAGNNVTTSYANTPGTIQSGVLQGPINTVPNAAPTSLVDNLNAPTPPTKPVMTTLNSASTQATNIGGQISSTSTAASTAAQSKAQQAMASAAATAASNTSADVGGTAPTSMVWPVQGPVLSGFGPKGQGLSNDGVNIGAPKGSAVVAASGGTVAYAGNEMKGFGNLVLIRHPGGIVTAYAHLDRVMVAKDAVVAQGDMIGTVGKTGSVSSPQLHFEVRDNGKAVDPAGFVSGSPQ